MTAPSDPPAGGSAPLAELLASNDMLDAVVRASPAAVMLLDGDGTVLMWNPAAEAIFGWTAAEVIGRRLPAIGPDDEAGFRANLATILSGHVIEGVETRRRKRDGSFDAAIWAAPVQRANGSPLCLSIVADVTARRRLEDSRRFLAEASRAFASSLDLRETLDRTARLAVDHLGDWCMVDLVTADRRHFDRVACASHDPAHAGVARAMIRRYALAPEVDQGVARVIARGEAVLISRIDRALVDVLARDPAHRALLEQVRARSLISAPLTVRREVIGALSVVSSKVVFDDHDQWTIEELARQAAASIENARLFAAEHHARDRIGRLQEVTSALSSATTAEEVIEVTCRIGASQLAAYGGVVWLLDGDGNLALAGSWGTPREFIDQFRLIAAGDRRFPAVEVVRTGAPVYVETVDDYAHAAPDLLPVASEARRVSSYAALPLRGPDGVEGVIVFSHPIGHRYDDTDRAFYAALAQNCAQALHRARLFDEARRASRAKDEFLAMLGHELRNPLAPIVTALDLLRRREAHRLGREHAIIERQVQHLRRLVDDLLDVSAITAGRVQLALAPVAIDDLVERAVEIARPLIEQRRHQLERDVARGLVVHGDPTRLVQVVTNLLTNAAKYTPAGGRIAIHARRDRDGVVVRVSDNGDGMTTELLPRVFDLFHQAPQPLDRAAGGLGLGLAIVKSLIAMHGGSVTAHSDGLGRGSEFVVTLPAVDPVGPDAAPQAAPRARRVLIVDDNEDAAVLLAEALALFGYDCRVAHAAPEALRVAAEFAPELALLDLGLPGMDGYQLSRELRKASPPPRTIAITGYGPEDRARTRDAGFFTQLVKPVDLAKLNDAIVRALG